ncbi:MAG: coproporphyrinogen III oxidase, partial [Lachnospiraceae bacterium]|nr:coproporphyrinogen III oxidase [Lachnospiraceae bacterium]
MKNEISVYVHLPFCVKKCNYCDFLSGCYPEEVIRAYLDRLLQDICLYGSLLSEREISTIYIGGGTPTVLPSSCIRSIMEKLKSITSLRDGCEISIEM